VLIGFLAEADIGVGTIPEKWPHGSTAFGGKSPNCMAREPAPGGIPESSGLIRWHRDTGLALD
jgi:hypothetical protein